jgi:hypothetical protein
MAGDSESGEASIVMPCRSGEKNESCAYIHALSERHFTTSALRFCYSCRRR